MNHLPHSKCYSLGCQPHTVLHLTMQSIHKRCSLTFTTHGDFSYLFNSGVHHKKIKSYVNMVKWNLHLLLRVDIPKKWSKILKWKWMDLQKDKLLTAVFSVLCVYVCAERDEKASLQIIIFFVFFLSLQIRKTMTPTHFFVKLPWQYFKRVNSL